MPILSESRVAICGLVRDCKVAAMRNWSALRSLESEAMQVEWVFVENDSKDGSREWLEDLAREHPNVTVLGQNLGEDTIPKKTDGQVMPSFSIRRMSKMAHFRNLYLDHVKAEIGLENLDAVMVIDFDVHSLPVDRIRETLGSLRAGEVITALGTVYQRPWTTHFYDCYAFRELGASAPQTYPEIDGQRAGLWEKFRNLCGRREVDSNFNGCAIYHPETFEGIRYEIDPNDDPQVECFVEHVGLHRQMRARGARIYLDPRLRVRFETAWSYWSAWVGSRVFRIRRT